MSCKVRDPTIWGAFVTYATLDEARRDLHRLNGLFIEKRLSLVLRAVQCWRQMSGLKFSIGIAVNAPKFTQRVEWMARPRCGSAIGAGPNVNDLGLKCQQSSQQPAGNSTGSLLRPH